MYIIVARINTIENFCPNRKTIIAVAMHSPMKHTLCLYTILSFCCPFLNFRENMLISLTRSAERHTESTGMNILPDAQAVRKLSGVQ